MTAKARQPTLPSFETNAVRRASIKLTRAGDGLSPALEVEPKALQIGEEITYVLRARVSQVAHVQREEDDPITRVHTLVVTGITEIDPEIAHKALTAAAEEIDRKRAEQEGQTRIDDE